MTSEEVFDNLKNAGIPVNSVFLGEDGTVKVDFPTSATQGMRNQAASIIASMSIKKGKHQAQDKELIKTSLKGLQPADLKKLTDEIILEMIAERLQRSPNFAQRLGISVRGDK